MKVEYANLDLINNTANHHFEMYMGTGLVFIEYKIIGTRIKLIHTEVSPGLRGHGAATAIVEKTLAFCEAGGLLVVPICPFVTGYIRKHPEWNRIVDSRMRIS